MNNRPDIDHEYLLALHEAVRTVLQTRNVEEAEAAVLTETKRLFRTAEVTLTKDYQTPPQPTTTQSQLTIPLTTQNQSFGTLYIFRDRPFDEQDMELADEWGLSIAETLLHFHNGNKHLHLLSTLAHDLRSPITSMKGYAQLLWQMPDLSDEQRIEFAKAIERNATSLMRLLNDLIDSARLEAGASHFESAVVDTVTLVNNIEMELSDDFALKTGQKLLSTTKHPVAVIGDKYRIIQTLAILIENASKYSDEHDVIKIEVTEKYPVGMISVIDNGIGISPSDQDQVFDKYFRSSDQAVRQLRGAGLSLYIAKLGVNQMGGEIGVASQLGQGSTFWFTLPLAEPDQDSP